MVVYPISDVRNWVHIVRFFGVSSIEGSLKPKIHIFLFFLLKLMPINKFSQKNVWGPFRLNVIKIFKNWWFFYFVKLTDFFFNQLFFSNILMEHCFWVYWTYFFTKRCYNAEFFIWGFSRKNGFVRKWVHLVRKGYTYVSHS